MRYLIAIAFAIAGALVATIFVSSQIADMVVSSRTFTSSDSADNLHMLTYLGTNTVGLVVGWILGWVAGGLLLPGDAKS